MLSLFRDCGLVLLGGAIGFFFSIIQWRLTLKDAEKNRKREKLEILIAQLSRYSEQVRQVVHKRNNNLYYPEVGPDPSPEIRALAALYAPEIQERFNAICKLYSETVEHIVSPTPDRFAPIDQKIFALQAELKAKILTLT